MATWGQIITPRGSYISPSFLITSNLDRFIATIKQQIINIYNQSVEVNFRVSYDELNWTAWEKLYETSYDFLDEYELQSIYIQFQINLVSKDEVSKPYFQSLELVLKPFTVIDNIGDRPLKPKIWITKRNGDGDISLINFTTKQEMTFKGIQNGEEIYIDCENQDIVSSNQSLGIYRYDSHNDEFLEIIKGENYLTSKGDFDFDIRYKGTLLQEGRF